MSLLWFDFRLKREKEFKERLHNPGCVFGWPLSLAGRAAFAVLHALELYLSRRNYGHVNLRSDQTSSSVNVFLWYDAHACYFAIIYADISFSVLYTNK